LGRVTSRTDTENDTTSTTYDLAGNVITRTDAKGNDTDTVYDARNRRTATTDRLSGVTAYAYDANGNLTGLADAEGGVTSYQYDARNARVKETYPDHTGGSPGDASYGIVEFAHDPAGWMLRKTDQLGDTVTFNYDLAGRMTRRDYRTAANSPSGTIADSDMFTHDDAGRTLTAASGRYNNTVTQTYDLAGRLKSEALTIGGQTYTVQESKREHGVHSGLNPHGR